MDDEQRDFRDILNLNSLGSDRWVELLAKYVDLMRNAELSVADRSWPIAGELLWASVMRANSELGKVEACANGHFGEKSDAWFPDLCKPLPAVVHLIRQLQFNVPDEVTNSDEIVTYERRSERSWFNIAAAELSLISGLLEMNASREALSRHFEATLYDHHRVRLQLEIEKKKLFDTLLIASDDRTTVRQHLVDRFWNEPQSDDPTGTCEPVEWSGYHPPGDWHTAFRMSGTKWRKSMREVWVPDEMAERDPLAIERGPVRFRLSFLEERGVTEPNSH